MKKSHDPLILALYPISRGLGFAFFEGIHAPVDWGVFHAKKNKNAECLRKVHDLIRRFKPDIVLLEDYNDESSNRAVRIRQLIDAIELCVSEKDIEIATYSRSQIRMCFTQFRAKTKYEIAQVIARYMPEFQMKLPPPRKAWLPEDYRMGIFDAVSLIYTHVYVLNFKKNTKGKKR